MRPAGEADDLNTLAAEDLVEAGGELGVPFANQEARAKGAVLEQPGEVPSLLGYPVASWRGGAADQVVAAAADLDEEEDVEALRPDRPSSITSGIPSSRRQISRTTSSRPSSRAPASRARSPNSVTLSERASGGTRQTDSPGTLSACRDVVSTCTAGDPETEAVRERGTGHQDVLAVVEQDQRARRAEPVHQRRDEVAGGKAGDAQGLGQRLGHRRRVADAREVDQPGASRVVLRWLAAALGLPVERLVALTRQTQPAGNLTDEEDEDTRRREFLALIAAGTAGLIDVERLAAPVDAVWLRDAEAVSRAIAAQKSRLAAEALIPAALGHLSALEQRLPVSEELTAQTALLTGSLLIKAGWPPQAYRCYSLAETLGDEVVRAKAQTGRAGVHARQGDARRALLLQGHAVETLKGAPPRARAGVLARLAELRAEAGDDAGAMRGPGGRRAGHRQQQRRVRVVLPEPRARLRAGGLPRFGAGVAGASPRSDRRLRVDAGQDGPGAAGLAGQDRRRSRPGAGRAVAGTLSTDARRPLLRQAGHHPRVLLTAAGYVMCCPPSA
jgi:hypothetical protein